jgi:hypothetical protein
MELGVIEILYAVMLAGSLAFGLEAMLLGLGGKLMVLYRRQKAETVVLALAIGIAIVGPAIATSMVLALEPLYFCVVVLAYMFVASGLINVFGAGLIRTSPPPPPPQLSERDIETMLRKRGLGKLVKKKRKR